MGKMESIVKDYIDKIFKDLDSIITFNEEFMKQDEVFETPKIDYIRLDKFITTCIKTLSTKDIRVKDAVFVKMQKEMEALIEYYKGFEKTYNDKVANHANIMVKQDPDFVEYAKDRVGTNLLTPEAVELKERTKKVFIRYFNELYEIKMKRFRELISFKYYLLDKVFWQNVNQSMNITAYFGDIGLKGPYSLKLYLKYYLRKLDLSIAKDKEYNDFLLYTLKKL
jgi:hypothetical protein